MSIQAAVSPHVQTRQGTPLASTAQLEFDSHSSFQQVPCSVSHLHNWMGHPHAHPKSS